MEIKTLGEIGAVSHYDEEGAHFAPRWASCEEPSLTEALAAAFYFKFNDLDPCRVGPFIGRFDHDDITDDSEPVELWAVLLPEGVTEIAPSADIQVVKLD